MKIFLRRCWIWFWVKILRGWYNYDYRNHKLYLFYQCGCSDVTINIAVYDVDGAEYDRITDWTW